MQIVVALLAVVAVSCAAPALDVQVMFEDFMTTYGKSYSASEEAQRFLVFQDNVAFINDHNARAAKGEFTFTVGINQFADLTLYDALQLVLTYAAMSSVPSTCPPST